MKKLRNLLFRAGQALIIVQATVLAVLVTVTVFFRYGLNYAIPWSEELSRYLLIWIGLIGTALGVESKGHLGFDYLYLRFPQHLRFFIRLVINMSISIFALGMFWYGLRLTYLFQEDLMESMPLRMYWLYIAMPLSGFMILVFNISELIDLFSNSKEQ